jgi:predicted aspartyl protease
MGSFRRIGRLIGTLSTIGIAVGITVPGLPGFQAIAQSCYMVSASGQRVSLGTLCGEAPIPDPVLPTSKRVQPPTRDGIYRTKIKRRLASTPVIDVSFNGKTFEMILDTGASNTLITKQMAEALRLNPKGYREVVIADGSTVKFPMTTIDAATSAGLPPRKLNVTVAENADIGLLGHDFFARYDVKIKRHVIEFQPQTE